MKPVLILQHQLPENAAYLTTWLSQHSIPYVIFNAGAGQDFPSSIESYSALAVMGGSISANDPLLSNRQSEILILQAMIYDIPVIGHCLGGQLMSKALGGTIGRSPKPEIGWQPIQYCDHALTKAWFGNNPSATVIHWHYETFSVPPGATLLASSEACPNQAFAIGKHLAMQFHIEIDQSKIYSWVNHHDPHWADAAKTHSTVQDKKTILDGISQYLKQHQAMANSIYNRWLSSTAYFA